jgi:hypothetical protein
MALYNAAASITETTQQVETAATTKRKENTKML